MKNTIILLAVFALLSSPYISMAACHKDDDANNPYCESWIGDPGFHSDSWDLSSPTNGLHLYMGSYGSDAYAYGSWSSTSTGSCYWGGNSATTTIDDYYAIGGTISLASYSSETSAFIAAAW